MTWKDFKAAVDAKLLEMGEPEDVEIWYIDVHHPTPNMEVDIHPDGEMYIND